VVIPADVNAVPPVQHAISKGIPVGMLALGPSGRKTSISLQVNNKLIFTGSCTYLGTQPHGDGTVLGIPSDTCQTTAQDRHTGFITCWFPASPLRRFRYEYAR